MMILQERKMNLLNTLQILSQSHLHNKLCARLQWAKFHQSLGHKGTGNYPETMSSVTTQFAYKDPS